MLGTLWGAGQQGDLRETAGFEEEGGETKDGDEAWGCLGTSRGVTPSS